MIKKINNKVFNCSLLTHSIDDRIKIWRYNQSNSN